MPSDYRFTRDGGKKSVYFRPKSQIAKLIKRDGLRCCWCSKMCDPEAEPDYYLYPTVEHVIPKSEGGSGRMCNLRIACKRCNNTRQSMVIEKAAIRAISRALSECLCENGPITHEWIDMATEMVAQQLKSAEIISEDVEFTGRSQQDVQQYAPRR